MGGCFPREPPPDFSGPVDFSHFHILRAVGKGAFGKVCIVKKRDTKQMYAMKYMNKIQIIAKHAVENVFREQELLSALEHPFLVNLWFTFQDAEDIFMVMDLMLGGDLSYHLTREGRFLVPRVVLYVAEMALVLEYLRERQIIHRDVKPANMLLDLQGHVHLTDFNVACVVKSGVPVTSITGTKPYMAPEVIHPGSKGYGYAVDWWSLGVSAYEMLRGQRPFHVEKSMTNDEIYAMLKHSHPTASAKWDENICDLLQRMLHPDDRKRLQSVKKMKELKCFEELNWADVEQGKATPSFIPPQNRINCDPTHELEEMIVEPNPLHKKATRLSKRQPHLEDMKTQAALDKINKEFITYNRTKERTLSAERKRKSNEVSVEYEAKGERVSFMHDAPQIHEHGTDVEHSYQDGVENDKREGAGPCLVVEVTADVHEELPHPQAQMTSSIANKEQGHEDNKREGAWPCAAVEVNADTHTELPRTQSQMAPDSDSYEPNNSDTIPLITPEGLAAHKNEISSEKDLASEQIEVVLGRDMGLGEGQCRQPEVLANCPVPQQSITQADQMTSNGSHTMGQPTGVDTLQPALLLSGTGDAAPVVDSYSRTTEYQFATAVTTTDNHIDQSIPQVPGDQSTSAWCRVQVDTTATMIPYTVV